MEKISFKKEVFILLAFFIISRIFIKLSGVAFDYHALITYWQYLDIESLKHNLLNSLWYQHSQPPVFNFLLGIVLQYSGAYTPVVFELIFLWITFINACLLLRIVKTVTVASRLPLFISLLYLLSPATILFENELFYTSFISMLLLLIVYFIITFQRKQSWLNAAGLFCMLTLLSLTKSLYHLVWLCLTAGILLMAWRNRQAFIKIITGALFSILMVTGWYVKNYVLFGSFSPSSWVGINLSRIAFHEVEIRDSSSIASVYPFLPISFYSRHISGDYRTKFAGLNDQVLLIETKNDSIINLHHAGYLEVSKKYMHASVAYIKQHPLTYLKHAAKSFVIFFSPASSYFRVQRNNNKIRYYDLLYSFNLSHFSKSEEERKLLLAVSAIPTFCIYLITFFFLVRDAVKRNFFSAANAFAMQTLLFVLIISTFFEYGENMRFRYEAEPLFLILFAQIISRFNIWRFSAPQGILRQRAV